MQAAFSSSFVIPHSSLNQLHHLFFAEHAAGALGAVVDALDALVRGFEAARFEPVDDVRFAAHRADLYLLAHAEEPGGHSRVDEVCEFRVALAEALNHRGGVDARRRAEGVAAEDGVVERDRPAAALRGLLAVLAQPREVVVNPAHELQVYEKLIHRRVADALADAQGRAVNLVGPALDGGDGVDDPEAAILVAVPVEAHAAALLFDDLPDEAHDRARAVGRGVADGVADADGARARAYRGRVERAYGLGVGARRVLGDEHDGQALAHGEGHSLLRQLQE